MSFRSSFIVLSLLAPSLTWGVADNIVFSGNPAAMTINSATAGSQPNSVTETTTTYGVQTAGTGKKITGHLDANTPAGVTLSVQLEAPSTGTSLGSIPLSTTPADLVSGIPFLTTLNSGLQITYTLSATVAASPAGAQNVTLTLTLI